MKVQVEPGTPGGGGGQFHCPCSVLTPHVFSTSGNDNNDAAKDLLLGSFRKETGGARNNQFVEDSSSGQEGAIADDDECLSVLRMHQLNLQTHQNHHQHHHHHQIHLESPT